MVESAEVSVDMLRLLASNMPEEQTRQRSWISSSVFDTVVVMRQQS
jgi:hypothetical protein